MRKSGVRAFWMREALECAALVAVLVVVSRLVRVPRAILYGLPPAKLAWSAVFYALFLRRSLRRPAPVGAERLVGRDAAALTPLAPSGRVAVSGEIWRAESADEEPIEEGLPVRVVGARERTLIVKRV